MFELLTETLGFGRGGIAAIAFLIVLSVVVVVHEYGHYIVGRWCGIHAEVFSLGFGPRLFYWTDKRGTEWQLAAIPLGGFVRFLGDADAASRPDSDHLDAMSSMDRSRSLPGASLPRRAATVVAGPVANFLLSIVIFAIWFGMVGVSTNRLDVDEVRPVFESSAGLQSGDRIVAMNGADVTTLDEVFLLANADATGQPVTYTVERQGQIIEIEGANPLTPIVGSVVPVSPAAKAGLRIGDQILSIDDQPVPSFTALRDRIMSSDEAELAMTIWRDGAVQTLAIQPRIRDMETEEGGFEERVAIGVSPAMTFTLASRTPGIGEALLLGVDRTWGVIQGSLDGLYHIFAGDIGADNLQGPLGIAMMSGDVAMTNPSTFLALIAMISAAIGLFNLFPIPVLDGGHLLIYLYEAIAGRPPSEKIIHGAMSVGLSLLLTLTVFALYNDIMRL